MVEPRDQLGTAVYRVLWLLFAVLVAWGLTGRVLLAWQAPTFRGYYYDDLWPAIAIVVQEGRLPDPSECWQCYHPPGQIVAFALALRGLEAAGLDRASTQWVPLGIDLLFSLGLLGLAIQLLRGLEVSPLARWGAFAVIAVVPKPFLLSASVNLDVPVNFWMLAASVLAWSVWKGELTRWGAVALGLVLAAGLATKYSGLLAVVACGELALLAPLFGLPARRGWRFASACLLAVALVAPIYGHNLQETGRLFPGNRGNDRALALDARAFDWPALRSCDLVALVRYPGSDRGPKHGLQHQPVYRSIWTGLYGMFWSDLGFFSEPGVSPHYSFPPIAIPPVVSTLVLVFGFPVLSIVIFGLSRILTDQRMVPLVVFAANLMGFAVVYRLIGGPWFLKFSYVTSAIGPLAVFLAVGLETAMAAGRWWKGWVLSLVGWQGLLCAAYTVFFVFSKSL